VFTYSASLALRTAHPVPLLRMAVPVLVSLAGIRFIARVFTVVFPMSGLARLVERLFSWLAWIAAVLWIVGLLPAVMREMDEIHFAFGASRISLLAVVNATLSAGAVLVVALWISAAVERKVLREAVTDLSLRKVAANAVRALLLLVGLLFALSAVGVDLTAFSVLGGALGVGIGFGLQKLAANYVSGFVILFERSLRIGDTVRVDGFEGVVVDIKTRYTLIRSLSGLESIVPNEKLITERIENLSLADPRVLLCRRCAAPASTFRIRSGWCMCGGFPLRPPPLLLDPRTPPSRPCGSGAARTAPLPIQSKPNERAVFLAHAVASAGGPRCSAA
jgi:hypothetical protein